MLFRSVISQAAESGVGFVAFSPLEQGVLTDRYLNGIPAGSRAARGAHLTADRITPALVARLRRLDDIARGRGQSLAEMSLAWVLKDSKVTSVIVGSSSVGQLADSLKCVGNTSFTASELAAIDEAING